MIDRVERYLNMFVLTYLDNHISFNQNRVAYVPEKKRRFLETKFNNCKYNIGYIFKMLEYI